MTSQLVIFRAFFFFFFFFFFGGGVFLKPFILISPEKKTVKLVR